MKNILTWLIAVLVCVGARYFIKYVVLKPSKDDVVASYVDGRVASVAGQRGTRLYREFEPMMDALIEGFVEDDLDAAIPFAEWYNSLSQREQSQVRDWAENLYEYSF
ncbi:MAG: hypothetical protein IKJ38_06405 [Alistipes sp.]|nr:hypothetical protein [Alistipes sp.]